LFASAHDRALFLKNPARYDGSGSGGDEPVPEAPPASESAGTDVASATPWIRPAKEDKDDTRPLGSQEEDVILGALPSMSGYCPVTLRKNGEWIRGRYEYRVELGDYVFLTAGPKERDELAKDSAQFVPALGGDCAVSFVARGERVRGSVYHAFEYDGRLFLFGDAERKDVFKASPAKYVAADWAAEGKCVVTRMDEKRETPGLAEHGTWYSGKLYRFASAEQKLKFLAQPEKYAEP
jgi:YHS domain-containing protein